MSEDIKFLLDLCREVIRVFKKYNRNKELPVDRNQLAKLKSIEEKLYNKV
ncbi:MAG: hypothetical protein ACFFCI_22625 [Promethearchaeota archaeon]